MSGNIGGEQRGVNLAGNPSKTSVTVPASRQADEALGVQDRPPNFRDESGRLHLVRCFACSETERGRENWAMAVASGQCAFCGWSEDARALLADQPDDQDDPTAGLPDDLARLLRDPRIVVPQDSAVWTLVGEARLPDGRNLWDALRDWQNAPSNTPSADQPDGGDA